MECFTRKFQLLPVIMFPSSFFFVLRPNSYTTSYFPNSRPKRLRDNRHVILLTAPYWWLLLLKSCCYYSYHPHTYMYLGMHVGIWLICTLSSWACSSSTTCSTWCYNRKLGSHFLLLLLCLWDQEAVEKRGMQVKTGWLVWCNQQEIYFHPQHEEMREKSCLSVTLITCHQVCCN